MDGESPVGNALGKVALRFDGNGNGLCLLLWFAASRQPKET